ncbi:MAG: hypothetical protein JSW53_05625 [Candidatus Bathyarchaeota archaeon]|nr:MAG: hypothetical protein JSW53_05625 [Candidatus Bathyarchaeota archaeon]
MAQRRGMRITPEDIENAEDVEIVEEKDHWNTYKLKDGSVIKMKLMVRGVKRLTTKWQPDGNPIYVVNSQNVMRLGNIPKKLKAKPKPSTFEPV